MSICFTFLQSYAHVEKGISMSACRKGPILIEDSTYITSTGPDYST